MTATNQAFIRAYRQDPPTPAPTAPVIAGQPAPALEVGGCVEFVSAGMAYTEATYVSAGSALSAGPVTVADTSTFREAPPEPPVTQRLHPAPAPAAPAWRDAQPPTTKRPLSSYRLDTPPQRPAPTALDVGTTVPNFRWPKVCQKISGLCAGPLDRIADVLESQAKNTRQLIGIASLHAGDGATTALLCVAGRLAARGRRTIVVDGNFAAPSLATRLGVQPAVCWQEVLAHGTPVGDAVVRAASDGLDLLPLDAASPDASPLATSLQASVTAGVLRYAYDLVLVDLGTLFAPRSQPTLLQLVGNMRIDAALAVTRPDADPQSVQSAAALLDGQGCELLGTIENRLSVS